jgi:hypothetical protein
VLVISLVGGSLVVALGLALAHSGRRRARDARGTAERAAFTHRFAQEEVPDDLLTHTYDALHRRLPGEDVDVQPTDRIRSVYRLSRLDLEDMALVIVARCGGRIPSAAELDDLETHVATVEDLVLYLTPFCRTAQLA